MTWKPTPDVNPYGQYGRIPAKFARKGMRVRFLDGTEDRIHSVADEPTADGRRAIEFEWATGHNNTYDSVLVPTEDIPWNEMTLSERQAVDLQYMH